MIQIDDELKKLEKQNMNDKIDDDNDSLLKFVEKHKLKSITINNKIKMAALAEIRFAENLKPGLTDKNKNEEYKFQNMVMYLFGMRFWRILGVMMLLLLKMKLKVTGG